MKVAGKEKVTRIWKLSEPDDPRKIFQEMAKCGKRSDGLQNKVTRVPEEMGGPDGQTVCIEKF